MLNATDRHGISIKKRIDILVYSLIIALGFFMGLMFIPYFLIFKKDTVLLLGNVLALIISIISGIYLYKITDKVNHFNNQIKNGKK